MSGARFVQYEHHGRKVWVERALKGDHRQFCLCYNCQHFIPEDEIDDYEQCPIAEKVYETCLEEGLVTPVWECPDFISKYRRDVDVIRTPRRRHSVKPHDSGEERPMLLGSQNWDATIRAQRQIWGFWG